MQVITLMTQKGGSGKTTIARGLLSAASARPDIRVGFLDADMTTNTLRWGTRANDNGFWDLGIQAYAALNVTDLKEIIEELDEVEEDDEEDPPLDLLIVDTPGDARDIHVMMFGLSDLIIVPLTLTRVALDTGIDTASFIHQTQEAYGQVAPYRGLLNGLDKDPDAAVREELHRVRTEPLIQNEDGSPASKFPLLKTEIRTRAAYREMESKGLLNKVVDRKSEPGERLQRRHIQQALTEMTELLDECLEIMGGKNG